MAFKKTALELAKEIAPTMRCNCDLDNWQPETSTDHSCVCRIHKEAWARYIASENRIYVDERTVDGFRRFGTNIDGDCG
jgi:hypothetical protein